MRLRTPQRTQDPPGGRRCGSFLLQPDKAIRRDAGRCGLGAVDMGVLVDQDDDAGSARAGAFATTMESTTDPRGNGKFRGVFISRFIAAR